jgi:hypothetical protein
MPLTIVDHTHRPPPRIYRIADTDSYFDVYFIRGPFDDSSILTAFVDPVGYDELYSDGVRKNLPPTFFQAIIPPGNESEWNALALVLVGAYLEYRRTGDHPWLIRPMDPVVEKPAEEPGTPVQRVSRYERGPVI